MATAHDNEGVEGTIVRQYLVGATRRGELLPGAADEAMRVLSGDPRVPAGRMLSVAHERVFGRTHPLTREHVPGELGHLVSPIADRKPELPAAAVLGRLAAGGFVRPESVEKLANAWAVDLALASDGRLAEKVLGRLEDRDVGEMALVEPPPIPASERRVRDALELVRGEIKFGTDLGKLARQWGDIGRNFADDFVINRTVAERLSGPQSAALWRDGAKPVIDVGADAYQDPRHARPTAPAGTADARAGERAAQEATGRYGI